jgi:replicative superfamily II helicase
MAFKKSPPPQNVPDSPEKILLDLPRRKIPGVLLHQGEVMKTYAADAIDLPDVALQLPTGSGKTLVGLMIGEWRRRKFHERVVYLCPTRQLVNQVVEQANDQYGLNVNGFAGPVTGYNSTAKAEYQNADRLAITTYSALFNTNPFSIRHKL